MFVCVCVCVLLVFLDKILPFMNTSIIIFLQAKCVWWGVGGIRWNQCPSVLDSGHCVFRMLSLSYTKLFIAVHCHGAQCHVKTFGSCLQGQGDSEGLYNQNGTV